MRGRARSGAPAIPFNPRRDTPSINVSTARVVRACEQLNRGRWNVDILIADDDRISRLMLENALRKWDYNVTSAEDGAEAWDKLRQPDAPKLVILDWMMPGMSGPEVCQKVRQLKGEAYVYIILLSAKDQTRDMVEGLDAGADDYLSKPFDKQELEARLRAARRVLSAEEALQRMSATDELTGLLNRRALTQKLNEEVERSARTGHMFALLMIDLDHFKKVNDEYGHQKGDEVLKGCADTLSRTVRRTDLAARYGGEEFCIVLPETSPDGARRVAEQLTDAVRALPDPYPTISVGVAYWRAHSSVDDIIRAADEALYEAKEAGRDRVAFSEEPLRQASAAHSPAMLAAPATPAAE